jgi:hypothetical protein
VSRFADRSVAGVGALLILLLASCGGGEDVKAGEAHPAPAFECPQGSATSVPPDERVAGYTEADLANLVEQRAAYELCDVAPEHLFDDPLSIPLYEEHGIVLLPQEERYWLDYQARYRPAREVVEQMRDRPGFLKARANVGAGTVTVWVTEETLGAFREQGERAGAQAGLDLRIVRYDLAQMEALRDELLSQLSDEAGNAALDVDIEPDLLVIEVADDDPAADEIEEALVAAGPDASRAAGVDVPIEVRRSRRNAGSGDF